MTLYLDHFGLKTAPFRNTPDPQFFFHGGLRQELLEGIVYALECGEPIVAVYGEIGSGKTMLGRMVQERLPDRYALVQIIDPGVTPVGLRSQLAQTLLGTTATETSIPLTQLRQELALQHAGGRRYLVMIDEAQALSREMLEEIRLLANLETDTDKLLQIVLLGQPELETLLAEPGLRHLRDRIAQQFSVPPLTADAVAEYLNARSRAAGAEKPLFSTAASQQIATTTDGLIRRINILADRCLLVAFAAGDEQVDAQHVQQATRRTTGIGTHGPGSRQTSILRHFALSIGALLLASGLFLVDWPAWIAGSGIPDTTGELSREEAVKEDVAQGDEPPGNEAQEAEAQEAEAQEAEAQGNQEQEAEAQEEESGLDLDWDERRPSTRLNP
jgi:MSHA biogenesis protein MshM